LRSVYAPIPFVLAVAVCGVGVAAGQTTRIDGLGVGKLLVSSQATGDPAFEKSVVLLVQYDRQGTVGLMINRRTQAAISSVLKDVNTSKRGADPIYIGGPVELDSVFALLRSSKKPDEAALVLPGVDMATTKAALEKGFALSSGDGDMRVYIGYCGWAPGQLENEVRLGGWWIFQADTAEIFDPHPESVWGRLIARTEQQIALREPVSAPQW
jgi:putative transcriptional regulator